MEDLNKIGTIQVDYGPLTVVSNPSEDADNQELPLKFRNILKQANRAHHYMLDGGFQVCDLKACLDNLAADIRSRNVRYYAWGPNSNTVARAALDRCGSYDFLADMVLVRYALPGWEIPLD